MFFPTNDTILDNFNRSDSAPMTGWTAITYLNTMSANGTVCLADADANAGVIWATSYDADQEAFVTISTVGTADGDTHALWGRIQDSPSILTINAYGVEYRVTSGAPHTMRVRRVDETVATQIGDAEELTLSDGDKIGMRITGTGATVTIEMWADSGSGWELIGTVTDTSAGRITSSGYIGLIADNNECRFDDFGGGDYASSSSSSSSSSLSSSSSSSSSSSAISISSSSSSSSSLSSSSSSSSLSSSSSSSSSISSSSSSSSSLSSSSSSSSTGLPDTAVLGYDTEGLATDRPTLGVLVGNKWTAPYSGNLSQANIRVFGNGGATVDCKIALYTVDANGKPDTLVTNSPGSFSGLSGVLTDDTVTGFVNKDQDYFIIMVHKDDDYGERFMENLTNVVRTVETSDNYDYANFPYSSLTGTHFTLYEDGTEVTYNMWYDMTPTADSSSSSSSSSSLSSSSSSSSLSSSSSSSSLSSSSSSSSLSSSSSSSSSSLSSSSSSSSLSSSSSSSSLSSSSSSSSSSLSSSSSSSSLSSSSSSSLSSSSSSSSLSSSSSSSSSAESVSSSSSSSSSFSLSSSSSSSSLSSSSSSSSLSSSSSSSSSSLSSSSSSSSLSSSSSSSSLSSSSSSSSQSSSSSSSSSSLSSSSSSSSQSSSSSSSSSLSSSSSSSSTGSSSSSSTHPAEFVFEDVTYEYKLKDTTHEYKLENTSHEYNFISRR